MLYPSAYSYDVEEEADISLITSISSATSAFDISPISPTELLYEPSSSYSTTSGSSTTASISMSPRSDLFDIADYYTAGPEMHTQDVSLSKVIPQDIVPLFPEASFTMQSHDFVNASQSLLDFGYEAQPQWMMDSVLADCPPLDVDSYIVPLSSDATSMDGMVGVLNRSVPPSMLVARETSPSVGPADADLQHYCKRLLSSFGASR